MDTSVVALETAEFSAGAEAGMGSPGLRTFRFKLIAPGETELILKEWREWEGEQSVENRFVVTLHATA